MGHDHVSGGVSVFCWLAAPVAIFYGNLQKYPYFNNVLSRWKGNGLYCHLKYQCQIWNLYSKGAEGMIEFQVFDGQTNINTDIIHLLPSLEGDMKICSTQKIHVAWRRHEFSGLNKSSCVSTYWAMNCYVPPGHLVSPLVSRGPWISTVVLYC